MVEHTALSRQQRQFESGRGYQFQVSNMNYYDDNYGDQFFQKFWDADLPLSPNRDFDVDDYYKLGVIRKDDLVDGAYYFGVCRNADVAQWDAKRNCFWYMRHKFGHVCSESINHISDDNGYDLFVPFQMIDNKDVRDGDKVR